MVDGDWIFVSGTTGFDYQTMTISEDIVVQVEQCLRNIAAALEQAGAVRRTGTGGPAGSRIRPGEKPASKTPLSWPRLARFH